MFLSLFFFFFFQAEDGIRDYKVTGVQTCAMMLVTRLASAFWWRRLFLKPALLPAPVDPSKFTDDEWRALGEGRPAEDVAVDDQFAAAAASALTTALGPWFAGERELNYEGFVDVLEWASSGFGKNPHREEP